MTGSDDMNEVRAMLVKVFEKAAEFEQTGDELDRVMPSERLRAKPGDRLLGPTEDRTVSELRTRMQNLRTTQQWRDKPLGARVMGTLGGEKKQLMQNVANSGVPVVKPPRTYNDVLFAKRR